MVRFHAVREAQNGLLLNSRFSMSARRPLQRSADFLCGGGSTPLNGHQERSERTGFSCRLRFGVERSTRLDLSEFILILEPWLKALAYYYLWPKIKAWTVTQSGPPWPK